MTQDEWEQAREKERKALQHEAKLLVDRAQLAGMVIRIESKLTPAGEDSRYYEIDVRHRRGHYPKESK